jgi:hypothetical protein
MPNVEKPSIILPDEIADMEDISPKTSSHLRLRRLAPPRIAGKPGKAGISVSTGRGHYNPQCALPGPADQTGSKANDCASLRLSISGWSMDTGLQVALWQ